MRFNIFSYHINVDGALFQILNLFVTCHTELAFINVYGSIILAY